TATPIAWRSDTSQPACTSGAKSWADQARRPVPHHRGHALAKGGQSVLVTGEEVLIFPWGLTAARSGSKISSRSLDQESRGRMRRRVQRPRSQRRAHGAKKSIFFPPSGVSDCIFSNRHFRRAAPSLGRIADGRWLDATPVNSAVMRQSIQFLLN